MATTIFEEMRRANADFYTASPLESLPGEQLADLAEEAGMTVEELRRYLAAPHVEMTCPLCGQPQTHLVGCKGCGGGAWGSEFEAAQGEDTANHLRQHLLTFLERAGDFCQNQVHHAVKHAYAWGGCQVCPSCWHNTLPYDAYQICPLNLVSERRLHPLYLPQGLLIQVGHLESRQAREEAIMQWLEATWRHWTEVWNTVLEGPERKAVAEWRAALLYAALMESPPDDEGEDDDLRPVTSDCVCGHPEEDHAGGYGECLVEGCLCVCYESEEEVCPHGEAPVFCDQCRDVYDAGAPWLEVDE